MAQPKVNLAKVNAYLKRIGEKDLNDNKYFTNAEKVELMDKINQDPRFRERVLAIANAEDAKRYINNAEAKNFFRNELQEYKLNVNSPAYQTMLRDRAERKRKYDTRLRYKMDRIPELADKPIPSTVEDEDECKGYGYVWSPKRESCRFAPKESPYRKTSFARKLSPKPPMNRTKCLSIGKEWDDTRHLCRSPYHGYNALSRDYLNLNPRGTPEGFLKWQVGQNQYDDYE